MAQRIDVHQHLLPPIYRDALRAAGIAEAGGRPLPDWSPEHALDFMGGARITTGVLSVSTPGTTFLDDPDAAGTLARPINEYGAELVEQHPDRIGHFATLPMPDVDRSVTEAVHALDVLGADGVVLLANARGTYLGSEGQDPLFAALDERRAVVFVHPAELPGPQVPGIPPFAADFLLDTTRAAYLLVRNGIVRRHPNIRFILSHASGFVPYAAHRPAMGMAGEDGTSARDTLTDLSSFYFDIALSASPASLSALLTFARPTASSTAATGPSRRAPGSRTSGARSMSTSPTLPSARRSAPPSIMATPPACSRGSATGPSPPFAVIRWPPPAPPSRTGPCEHCSSSPTRRPAPVFAHGEGPFPTEPVPIQPPSSASTGVRRHLTDLGDVTMCQQEGVTRRQR